MISLKLSGFCFAVCVVLAVFLLLPSYSSAQNTLASRYETYSYQVAISNYQCRTYYYTYCYNWWYWNYWYRGWYWNPYYYYGYYWNPWYGYGRWGWCNTYPQQYCYYYYTYETREAQRCQAGWVGSLCNVPTCTPTCATGMVCVDLNKCGCTKDGSMSGGCEIVPCSPTNNCYPGTCVGGSCKCPPGFSGPNCINFDHKPAITTCYVKLSAKPTAASAEIQVAVADCAAEGLTPQVTWINGANLDRSNLKNLGLVTIEPTWTASYTFPTAMPSRPQLASSFFITNTPVRMGIYDGSFTVSFPESGFETSKIQCSYPNMMAQLPTTAECRNPTPWDSLNVNSQIGHNKTMVIKMSAVLGGTKTGDSTYLLNGIYYGFGDQKFNGTPIVVQSMLKFDLRPPTHCLLQRTSSITPGNGRINCTIYPIYLDQDIRTSPVIKPIFLDWTDDGSGIRIFHVEVFYMQPDVSGEQLEPNGRPLTDSVADVTPDVNNYQFTVPTPGVYSIVVTAYDYANNSATARKIFNYMNEPSYTITTSPVYIQEANEASNYTFITSLTNRQQLTLVWPGRFQPHPLYRTVLSKKVRPRDYASTTMDDIYGSQFGQRSINAVDNQTGISSYTVRYLVDSDNGGLTALPTDTNTTATINGETATLTFDSPLTHGDTVVVWLTATGSTGNQTTYQLNVGIDTTRPNVSDVQLVKNAEYGKSRVMMQVFDLESGINATTFSVVDKLNNGMIVIAEQVTPAATMTPPNRKKRSGDGSPAICSASNANCYCTTYGKCFPYSQTIDLDNCVLDRYKGDQFNLVFRYTVSSSSGLTVSGELKLGDLSDIYCRTPPGIIAAIVIGSILGFIILVCLVIFIVLIIIRVGQRKHPIPSRQEMRTYAGNVRDRFTIKKRKETENEMYGRGSQEQARPSEPPPKINKDKEDSFKISPKQIQLSETLAEGKFAVIRRAFYLKTNNKDTVAAKALKNGFSQSDELLMSKKVSFMKNVPTHGNLVQFIGFMDESDGQGPIMILELCDFPLKDWLANLSEISADHLELMLNFTLNIAQGVAHLHTHKIFHRRLAVRNILLKQQANGLVAKLIGFGPTAEDDKTESAGTGVSLPLKWMAPETLDSMNRSKPVYNEKTDAWSYGVTVWEIYSKGAAPYSDVKSGDIKSQVSRGLRLQCPRECPPQLFNAAVMPCWNGSAKDRPTFNAIVNHVQQFRSGSQRPPLDYYDPNEVRGQELYTNQEMYSNAR